MQEGERNPVRDSAALRNAAVSAALAEAPEEPGLDTEPSAAEPSQVTSEAPDAGATEPVAESTGASLGQKDVKAGSTEPLLSAPNNWPKDRQTEFAALDERGKRILLARDKEYTQGIHKLATENSDHRKRSEAITEILKPYEADLRNANLDHAGAVRFVLDERAAFNRDPVAFVANFSQRAQGGVPAFIKALIERSGLTQDQLFGGQKPQNRQANEPDQDQEWVDPHVLEVRSENQALRGELQTLIQHFGQFQQHHSQREALTIKEEIQAFQSASDESGNPVRPHYEEVIPIMQNLMDTDPEVSRIPDWKAQEKLQAAYDKAVWLVPEIRKQLIESQVNLSVSSQLSQANLDKAKAAATRKPSPGANGQSQPGRMGKMAAIEKALRDTGHA